MEKPIFCSIYSVDNTKRSQKWFIKELIERIEPYKKIENKPMRIESDWQSIKPSEKLFNDRCKDSTYIMFLYDGSENNNNQLEHYQLKATALHESKQTVFVPIGLDGITHADFEKFGLQHYKPFRFLTNADNGNSWRRLLEEICPDERHQQIPRGPLGASGSSIPLSRRREDLEEDDVMCEVLQRTWPILKDSLDLKTSDSILDHLNTYDIISLDFKETLTEIQPRKDKTEALLNHLVRRRSAEDIERFFDLLKKDYRFLYDDVVEEINCARARNAKIADPRLLASNSTSISFPGGGRLSDPPVSYSVPESDETHVKTEQMNFDSVTQKFGQVSLSGDHAGASRAVQEIQQNLSLNEDDADGSEIPLASAAEQNLNVSNVSNERSSPNPQLQYIFVSMSAEPFKIRVRRGDVLKGLMAIFRKVELKKILQAKVEAEFVGETSGSGVLLDILSEFWDEFFQEYSEGEDEKVPLVHDDLNKNELKCAGRILRFGFGYQPDKDKPSLHFFPHQLCLASIIDFIHPESISQNLSEREAIWCASFYAFLGPTSGAKIKAVYDDPVSASEDVWEDINEMLNDRFPKMKYLVDAGNIKKKISKIMEVHLLLNSQPSLKYMELKQWKEWYPEEFGDIDRIVQFSTQLYPTSDAVVKALKENEPKNKEERDAQKNLRRFIRDLNEMDLRKFLRFVTGSALKPKEILVEFSDDENRPINARTCGSLLYIPLKPNFNQFKKLFSHIISSELHQDMTSVLPH